MSTKLVSRSSTLEAARTVYFIVVGLAIKQSLGLFAHVWPSKDFPSAPIWPFWVRVIIATGYLVTVIRFSHGVTLLYGHEKERIENSNLPSASKISQLSLFLVLLAIPLFLMADNIINLNSYILWTAAMLAADFVYVWRSNVVRRPLTRIFRLLDETNQGYAAHAAFWWMANDAALFLICVVFFIPSGIGTFMEQYPPARELVFAGVLLLAALADYWLNWDFYFGGRQDRRSQKFVFVISPLRNQELTIYKSNINRAQWYCLNLMKCERRFRKRITPLASHAFFTYFLNDGVGIDRQLGVECALAYLSACDAIYVYLPMRPRKLKAILEKRPLKTLFEHLRLAQSLESGVLNRFVEEPVKDNITRGMEYALDTARKQGLRIEYKKAIELLPPAAEWSAPNWRGITYVQKQTPRKPSESYFKGAAQRKKVYVCTSFRGKAFRDSPWEEQKRIMEDSTKLALWHCLALARDEDEAVAPFAPQAFYPYFWKFTDPTEDSQRVINDAKFEAWFQRSIEMLKVCDAVYIYTAEGLPPSEDDSSEGVLKVDETAQKLGLEIQYRKELDLPDEELQDAEAGAQKATAESTQAAAALARAEQEFQALQVSADSLAAALGEDNADVRTAKQRAHQAKLRVATTRTHAEQKRIEAEAKGAEVEKKRWNPAVPEF